MSGNACRIKFSNPEVYDGWKNHFLTSEEWNNPDIFKNAKIYVKGRSITIAERITLLKSIQEDVKLEGEEMFELTADLIQETVEFLDELINGYGTMTEKKHYSKVIKNAHFTSPALTQIKNPLSVTTELGAFIPIVSSKINAYITDFLYSKFKEACIWDEAHETMIDSDDTLTISMDAIKAEFIGILQTYTGVTLDIGTSLYMTDQNITNYNILLEEAWKRISAELNALGNIVDVEPTPLTLKNIINPITAFYVLQNFDTIVNLVLSDFIVIDPVSRDSVLWPTAKYKRKQKERKNFSYNSDHHSADGDNLMDHLLITFVSNVVVDGKHLDKGFIDALYIKGIDWYENTKEKKDANTGDIRAREIIHSLLTNESLSMDDKIEIFIELLLTDSGFTLDMGLSRCEALADRLIKYLKAYEKLYLATVSSRRAEMDIHNNVAAKLINLFTSKGALALSLIRNNSEIQYIQAGHKKKSKEGIRKLFTIALTNALLDPSNILFSKGLMIGNTSADWLLQITSPAVIRYLSQITGFSFSDKDLLDKFKDTPLTITKFIRAYRQIVLDVLQTKSSDVVTSDDIKTILDNLAEHTAYIAFSNIIVGENDYHLERMFDAEGKELPKTTINTVTTLLSKAIDRFKKAGFDPSYNVLTKLNSDIIKRRHVKISEDVIIPQGDFVLHINYAGDVEINGESTKWVDLTECQLFETWINSLYVDSIVKKQVFSYLLDAASDKPRVPIGSVNSDTIYELTIEQLINARRTQSYYYYLQVEKSILDKWKLLFANDAVHKTSIASITSLKLLAEYVKQQAITLDTLTDRLVEVQAKYPKFTFLAQIDYIALKDGTIVMNNSLLAEIDYVSTPDKFRARSRAAFDLMCQNLDRYKPTIRIPSANSLSKEEQARLAGLLGVERDKLLETITSINGVFDRSNPILQKFLAKWFHMYNLFREADTELFQKHYWAHGNNSTKGIIDEETGRINKSKKRNNALSATFSTLQQGLKYGVPSLIRTITIELLKYHALNHFGQQTTLSAHDGAIFSTYIMRLLERNSSLDVHVSDVTKIIALSQSGAGFELIKCADYAMTNSWIRNTIKQPLNNTISKTYIDENGVELVVEEEVFTQYFDGKKLMQQMLSPAKFSINNNIFFKNWINSKGDLFKLLGTDNPIVYFSGKPAVLTNIEPSADGTVYMKWKYLDSGRTVANSVVQSTLELSTNENGHFILDSLYDLWKAFGAEYSCSTSEDGTIEFSDISLEIVALLMCEFDPSLKFYMIGKAIDENASKSTMQFKNSRKRIFGNQALVTGTLNTSSYGVQQDTSHLSEEDEISSLTLVMNAIALNGENPEIVQEMYELLGSITAQAIEEILDIEHKNNKTDFYLKLGKSIYQELSRNKVVSNALVILSRALLKVIPNTELFAKLGLPLSSNQLYHFVTSELLSKLNRIIKQKFTGTAVVQNPALGIIGIYEDKQGRVYTRSEILQKAFDWASSNKKRTTSYDALIDMYFAANEDFTPTIITLPQSLNIGHVIRFSTNGTDQYGPFIHIESPLQLRDIQAKLTAGALAVQIFTQQRNLTTTNVWWDSEVNSETGIESNGNNIWSIASMNALLSAESDAEYKAALTWHRANLRALLELGGYYKTEEDFNTLTLTKVRGITRKSGEEVLPKYYKNKLGILGSLADIKIAKYNHFLLLAEERLKPHAELSISKYITQEEIIDKGNGKSEIITYNNSFIVTTDTIDIVFYSDTSETSESNVIIEKDGNNRVIIDEYGNKIDVINVPNIDATITLQSRDKGKSTLFFNISDTDYLNHRGNILSLIDSVKNVNGVFNDTHKASGFWYTNVNKLPNPLNDWLIRTKALLSKESLQRHAEKAYLSFLLTLRTISARIPSLSFQSFLPNETVAFTETGENNGYMNLWEMWFLGSDYDIDKAYTMMFGLNSAGIIEGNIFTDYSSPESIMKSLLLPNPEATSIIEVNAEKGLNITKDLNNIIVSAASEGIFNVSDFTLDIWKEVLLTIRNQAKSLRAGLVLTITQGEFSPEVFDMIKQIVSMTNIYNDMNNYSETYFKNKVMATIRFASEDLRNLLASEVPMDAKYVNDRIDNSVAQVGTGGNKTIYINEDPTHIINFLFLAAIGKKGVGISANAIKATGSIQQNANTKHLAGQDTPDFKLDLSFTIHKNIDGNLERYTITEALRYVPNSKFLSFELFKAMFRDVLVFDPLDASSIHPLMEFFQNVTNGIIPTQMSEKQQKIVDSYQILTEAGFNPTLDLVLFYMYQTEENTADMISIFISLCTDNAKELQLYRIAGTPELLNIPLSLISLGMTVLDTTDICVLYLIPVLDKLNVGVGAEASSIPSIINELAANGPESLRVGYESLKSVLKVADELKTLTGYFKINLGTSVKYAEVLDFLNRMDSLIQEIGSDLGYSKISMLDLLLTDNELESLPQEIKDNFLNLHSEEIAHISLTMDKLRLDFINNYESKHKTAFNILELIFKAPHYFALLRATAHMIKAIENNIGVANIASNIFSKMREAKSSITSTKITLIVLNVCFGNALQTMLDIVFSKDGTVRKYGNWDPELSDLAYIGVSTQVQVNNLLRFVEHGLIPVVKLRFKGNFFIESLIIDPNTGHYTLPFNSYESKADMRIKLDINKTIFAFSLISGHDSGLRTLYDEVITIGDLFLMYSNIVNQNRTNTMSSIIHAGTTNVSTLNFQGRLSEYYSELDRITGIASTPSSEVTLESRAEWLSAKDKLNEVSTQAYNYVRAFDDGGEYVIKLNDEGVSSKSIVYSVNLDDKTSIYSMTPGTLKTTLGMEYNEQIITLALEAMLKSLHTGATLVISPNTKSGVSLYLDHIEFTVNIPSRTGRSSTKSFSYPITLIDNKISQALLSGLLKEIGANIGSIYLNIQFLLTNLNAKVYLNVRLSEDIPAFKSILSKFKEEFENDLLYLELVKWGQTVFSTVLVLDGGDYVHTHIDKYGSENVLVLSKADFNDAVVPKDKLLRLLLNLMFDADIEGLPSENKRFKVLLNKLGISKGFLHNLTFAMRQQNVQQKLKETLLGQMYYENLVEFAVDEEVKKHAMTTVQLFSRALLHADKYFYDVSNIPLSHVQIGDILLDKVEGTKYMLVGSTSDAQLILVGVNPEKLGNVKLSYRVSTDGNLLLILRMKLHSNHSMGTNSILMPNDGRNIIKGAPESIHVLSKGDSFAIGDSWRTITDVLYYKNGSSYSTEYVVVDNNGIEEIFTEDEIPLITQHAFLSATPMKSLLLYQPIKNFELLNDDVKHMLLKVIGYGHRITFKLGGQVEEGTIKKVEKDSIVTFNNKIVLLKDILSCEYMSDHVTQLDPLVKYAILSDWIRIVGLDFDPSFVLLPELRLGVQLHSKDVGLEVADYAMPSHKLFIDPEVTRVSKKYNTISKGDYIVAVDNSFYIHILEVSGDFALVSRVDLTGLYTLEVDSIPNLKAIQYPNYLYKRFDQGTSRIELDQHIQSLSSDDLAIVLLNRLSTAFGTHVKVGTFDTTDQAFIEDGTVCINVPTNLDGNLSDYILQKGLHEFAHLALVAIRAKDPDTYAKLIASIDDVIRFNSNSDLSEHENNVYNSKTKKIEEYLVRAITAGISGKVSLDEDVLFIIKKELISILGGDNANLVINDVSLLSTVKQALETLNDFNLGSKDITLNDLRAKALSESILDKITYKCE